MERIIYRKTLDLHKNGVQFTLQGFQTADNMARTLELSLMASGDTIDLPLEQLMAVMYVTTPKATEPSIIECTIKDNTVVCDVPPIVEEGITEIQLKLIETGVDGAGGVLAIPKFAIEVSKSDMNEGSATQNTTFSALETALAKAKGVYDSRVTRIVLSPDCIFSVYYADGTIYTSDALKEVLVNGESLIAKSYARGGTGVRDGEDTDNSMYYSNVSKSSSIEANTARENSLELLEEVRKHGVYTAFSFNFEKGELEYVSPMYKFEIDEETGELVAIGETYTFEETIGALVEEELDEKSSVIEETKSMANTAIQTSTEARTTANEALSIAKGKNQAHVFDTTEDLYTWLSSPQNAGKYQVGDNLYVVEMDVPNWWITEVLTVADEETGYYYKIAELETQKVDLTEITNKLNAMSDYPIESGYQDGWYWEKWNSGKLVQWGRFESTDVCSYDETGTTCSINAFFPIKFLGHPTLSASALQLKTYNSYLMMSVADGQLASGYLKCMNPINSEFPCYFQFHAVGRWK